MKYCEFKAELATVSVGWSESVFSTVTHVFMCDKQRLLKHSWQAWAMLQTLKDREERHKYAHMLAPVWTNPVG